MLKEVSIYTDGACSGNPGKGGWAAILIYNGNKKEISGFCPDTTNNRMELFAVICAFKALKQKCKVTIHSDSAYIVNAFNDGWVQKWLANNWKTSAKEEVKNIDLWQDLIRLSSKHEVTWVKVKGHSDDVYNNRCDELARRQIENN